jgi:hypothetical protein
MASIKGIYPRRGNSDFLPRRPYPLQEFPVSITESKHIYPQGTYHLAILATQSASKGE